MDILHNQLITGGLFLGILTSLVYGLKSLGEKLINKIKDIFIFRVVIYDYDELFYVIEDYISSNYPNKYKNLEASYEKTRRWVTGIDNDDNRVVTRNKREVKWKQEPNIFTIKVQGKRLYFSKDKKELEHATDLRSMLNFHYSISGWRGKKVIQKFLNDITEKYNESLINGKISVYSADSSGGWSIIGRKTVKTLDKVVLEKKTKEFLIRDLNDFKASRSWYESINITYKRSFLLHGPPGTGKTTTAQAVAAYMNKDICIMNLAGISSDNLLIDLFSKMPENGLLLIEDIDCVFNGRTPVSKDVKITFSCLLNCLDGIISKDGSLSIVTTNHIEKLDEALIRAGRMDVQVEMPLAGNAEIEEYLQLFYNKFVWIGDDQILINMSAVQESCIQNKENSDQAITDILTKVKIPA